MSTVNAAEIGIIRVPCPPRTQGRMLFAQTARSNVRCLASASVGHRAPPSSGAASTSVVTRERLDMDGSTIATVLPSGVGYPDEEKV
jgi:hypothetical protein